MSVPARGLPPRIYLPIFLLLAAVFLGTLFYLLSIAFRSTGAVLGPSARTTASSIAQPRNNDVGGGPPAAVQTQLSRLRSEIAAHPNNDVALTQLGDLYLTAGKYREAIPFYRRALKANPHNVAAQSGLQEATAQLSAERQGP